MNKWTNKQFAQVYFWEYKTREVLVGEQPVF